MEDTEYAGFWIRCGASLIDTLIFVVVISIPMTLIYGDNYWFNFPSDQVTLGYWDFLLTQVTPIVGTIWFWLRFMGTPGKMILAGTVVIRIRTTDRVNFTSTNTNNEEVTN